MQQDSLAGETRPTKPQSIAAITALAGIAAFLAVIAVWYFFLRPPAFVGTVIQPPYEAPDFTLMGGNGETIRLSDYQGKVVVLFFGYTSCPDVCPTTLLQLKQAMAMLGPKADEVKVMFLSIDPGRDTPERVGKYAANFDPRVVGVTGTQEQVRDVVIAYGAYFEYLPQDSPDNYLVIHSANLYVIDREGQMAVVMPPGASAKDIAHDLRLIVADSK